MWQIVRPLQALKELGGWSGYNMTQKYAHLSPEHLEQHVENVSGLFETGVNVVATNQLRLNVG